mmetsp:Transcript_94958/g.245253  ORF Transcript_94958/g.245253 Transcript_94958/m.245253 type:complete len:660 (+) Transcript_94958:52-2031(+)
MRTCDIEEEGQSLKSGDDASSPGEGQRPTSRDSGSPEPASLGKADDGSPHDILWAKRKWREIRALNPKGWHEEDGSLVAGETTNLVGSCSQKSPASGPDNGQPKLLCLTVVVGIVLFGGWLVLYLSGSTPRMCVDGDKDCPAWAQLGECQRNPKFMLSKCPPSCGQCQASEAAEPVNGTGTDQAAQARAQTVVEAKRPGGRPVAGNATSGTKMPPTTLRRTTTRTTTIHTTTTTIRPALPAGMIDPSCVLQVVSVKGVVVGGKKSSITPGKQWRLTTVQSRLNLGSSVSSDRSKLDKFLSGNVLLCRVVANMTEKPSQGAKTALLTMADHFTYLHQEKKRGEDLWEMLGIRSEYARYWKLPLFIWLGSLTDQWQKKLTFPSVGRDGAVCKEKSKPLHVVKSLAALALMERFPGLKAVAFMDADTKPINWQVSPDHYLGMEPSADFFVTSNFRYPIIANGGVWILRNTLWGRQLMQRWWLNQCSEHDQGPLWHSLFEMWKQDVPEFQYSPEMFSEYDRAHREALVTVVDAVVLRQYHRDSRFLCNGLCGRVYSQTGCLISPLQLPRTVLLPVVPFYDEESKVLPLQNNYGQLQWLCHFDTRADTCYKTDVDKEFSGMHEQVVAKTDYSKCRVGKKSDNFFDCRCHKIMSGHNEPVHGKNR